MLKNKFNSHDWLKILEPRKVTAKAFNEIPEICLIVCLFVRTDFYLHWYCGFYIQYFLHLTQCKQNAIFQTIVHFPKLWHTAGSWYAAVQMLYRAFYIERQLVRLQPFPVEDKTSTFSIFRSPLFDLWVKLKIDWKWIKVDFLLKVPYQ